MIFIRVSASNLELKYVHVIIYNNIKYIKHVIFIVHNTYFMIYEELNKVYACNGRCVISYLTDTWLHERR